MKKHKPIQVGDVFPTNEGGSVVVVEYRGAYDVIVRHSDSHGHLSKVAASQLRDGRVKNPYLPRIYGVGYIGVGAHPASIGGKDTRCYTAWSRMMERCYSAESLKKNPSYIDCKVCPEWHNFQNFAEWYESQEFKGEGYELDKDILIKGNRVYCPTACRLVPSAVNKVLRNNSERRGALPIGMQEKCGRFYVKLSKFGEQVTVGSYESKEDAFSAYKSAREQYVKECAERYRQVMSSDVYESLCTYSVEIDD